VLPVQHFCLSAPQPEQAPLVHVPFPAPQLAPSPRQSPLTQQLAVQSLPVQHD
jgi:hypothetical protein